MSPPELRPSHRESNRRGRNTEFLPSATHTPEREAFVKINFS
jgi:hypothetical protein